MKIKEQISWIKIKDVTFIKYIYVVANKFYFDFNSGILNDRLNREQYKDSEICSANF